MGNAPVIRPALAQTLSAAEASLQGVAPTPFSRQAFEALQETVARYIVELVTESVKTARRHRADTVSPIHVQTADSYLVSRPTRRVYKHLGTIGAMLLGAATSNTFAMVSAGQYSALSVVVTAVFLTTGASLTALHWAKD